MSLPIPPSDTECPWPQSEETVSVSLPVPPSDTECPWPQSEETVRRRHFCDTTEGYGSVCSCSDPAPLQYDGPAIASGPVVGVPVLVIASNRPHYLYRWVTHLLPATLPLQVGVATHTYTIPPIPATLPLQVGYVCHRSVMPTFSITLIDFTLSTCG